VKAQLTTQRVQQVGRRVADRMGGAFFWLKEGMGVARVILPGPPLLQLDVVPLEGDLETDLRRRDFTINAMALPLAGQFGPEAGVIDPTGGLEDLAGRRLRLAGPDALERDPLRCLRAFRFRATLGFGFEEETEVALRTAAPGLAGISGERIRDELFALLETPVGIEVVGELLAHDLVSPWSRALDASARGTEAAASGSLHAAGGLFVARELEQWFRDRAPKLDSLADLERTLKSRVTPPRSRRALLRLSALSSSAGPRAPEIARTLALSTEEGRVLIRAVAGADALDAAWPVHGRDRLRFWQQWEPGAVEAVLVDLARATRGRPDDGSGTTCGRRDASGESEPTASVQEALLGDLLERRLRPKPPLLTGSEVMELLGLPPGPEVGRMMQRVEEQRADGLLSSSDEARTWLQRQRPAEGRNPTD
jgi:poly(A) polymerase